MYLWVSGQAYWSLTSMSVSDQACRSPTRHVGLWWGMFVSDEACLSPMRHVCLRWGMSVSDQTYQSLMRHVGIQSNISVSEEACRSLMGIQWGMLFFDGCPIGLRWVSDNNNIFTNSVLRIWSSFPYKRKWIKTQQFKHNFVLMVSHYVIKCIMNFIKFPVHPANCN